MPDIDVIGFRFGIHYGDFWGHRGFTHSLVFAALLSGAVTPMLMRRGIAAIRRSTLFAYLFLATASHGVLDAMTNGGLGVAFFSPFDNRRYFLPWRPIRVSPISIARFFSARGHAVLESELLWIWLSSLAICVGCAGIKTNENRTDGGLKRSVADFFPPSVSKSRMLKFWFLEIKTSWKGECRTVWLLKREHKNIDHPLLSPGYSIILPARPSYPKLLVRQSSYICATRL